MKESEIQKLRQIQVQKLDQEEETRALKKKHREVEQELAKLREQGAKDSSASEAELQGVRAENDRLVAEVS